MLVTWQCCAVSACQPQKGSQEVSQETCAPPQAQGRSDLAQEHSLLQESIPQVSRHVDCQLYFNIMWNRYKAVIYLNGTKVQEMFDFSLHELKERLRKRIDELDATSHTPLTKAVLGPLNRLYGIVRLRLFRCKQLKRNTLFLLAQNRTLDKKVCTRDPVYRISCFESQGKYYHRPYCHLMCRRSTLKGHSILFTCNQKSN